MVLIGAIWLDDIHDIEIDGIPCRGLQEVQLYPDGKLWVCFLSRDFDIDGTLYTEGTFLIFDENGKVEEYSYELYQDIRDRLDLPQEDDFQ